ncbi:MAG: dihydrolipoyl dehydrogenase, partial [Gammaproteobacteria bacterium]|nr:dihydrolipoyl dehydrogenase [Gammaproteobacteria bacterium]
MAIIDIKVPDIGDFAEVAIIEVLVKPGDTIKAEQSLITVESDKASMEIPSSHAGVVKELKVKLGDNIAEGSVVLTLEVEGAAAAAPTAAPAAPAPAPTAAAPVSDSKQAPALAPQALAAINPVASSFAGTADLDCDVLVLGGGPGGYSAAFRAADLGLKVVI